MIINNKILLEQAEHVEQRLHNVKPLMADSELMTWFADDFALRFCWSSNAIEGNTLSLDETVALVEYDEVRSGHTYTEYQNAKNLYRAIRTSMIPFCHTLITEDWIKGNNRLIRGTDGEYRSENVRIGNLFETSYMPPAFVRVPGLMQDFLNTINFPEEGSLIETFKQISIQHMTFEQIHPFKDGNGRTGRMILNQQLINHGFLPVSLTKDSSYMQAFRQYDRNGDYSKMLHSILKAEEDSIDSLLAFEKKREQGLNWSPKSAQEKSIGADSERQAKTSISSAHKKPSKDEWER